MRSLFSLVGLLLVLAVIGWLAKTQLSGRAEAPRVPVESSPIDRAPVLSGSPADVQQQYRKALQDAMQPARAEQVP